MNGFQKRAIGDDEKPQKAAKITKKTVIQKSILSRTGKWIKSHIALSIILAVLAVLLLRGVVGAINTHNLFSLKQIAVSAISEPIKTDDAGNTNILLIGVGGEGHDGENLTDTMIVASVDYDNNMVPMLSIPRDIYVENEVVGWGTRINGIYEHILDATEDEELAMSEFLKEIEGIIGMEVHYFVKVDFNGFTGIVDALGGVEIEVEEEIYDPYYPGPDGSGIIYEPFSIQAGLQELDGETALKYARSRYTTSDFDRAHRQQKLISAIKDKALSVGFLLNPMKIKNTLAALANSYETNLSLSQMLNFASVAADFSGESMVSAVLSDDIWTTGGFLYPPEREYYGGAFVLVPYRLDFSEIHHFADLFFHNPEVQANQVSIELLNGTEGEGLAGLSNAYLTRYGFNVVNTGNAESKDAFQTRIFPAGESNAMLEQTMEALAPLLVDAEILTETPTEYDPLTWGTSEAEIIVEFGTDYLEFFEENEDLYYYEYIY
jgi:polyisoprenyl-teichoic acid--peptidoglycan teichoic acid transferase